MFQNYSIKKIILESIKFLLIIFIITNIISYIRKPELSSNNLPSMTLNTISGKTFTTSSSIGKPLIVYFWGSWCPVCKLQSPTIDSLSKEYYVISIAVNSGNDIDIKKYMEEKDLHFQTINDSDGNISQSFHIGVFPTTFIYNEKGINTFTDVGLTSLFSLKLKIWLNKFL